MKWWPFTEKRAALTQRSLRLVEHLAGDPHFGQIVSAITSEYLSAVTASVDAIAGTVASLPAYCYRITDDGRQEDPNHPLTRLVRDGSNDHQSWPDFVQWLMAETLRYGNGTAEIVRDTAGRLVALKPIPADRRGITLLQNGRLAYDFSDPATLERRRILDGEVLHLRDRSDDGLIGRPRHERASPVVAAALALAEHNGALFQNGTFPSGAIELDHKINKDGVARLQELFKQAFSGPSKAGKAILLPGGTWKPITATPADSELLAARRFAIEEAARLYGVPPPIIGDLSHGTFTNSETLIRFFAQSTIATWCRKIEAEIHRSALSDTGRRTHRFELDLSGLLRGDPETRWKSHEVALKNRVLTPNEIRELEGWNPRPGGDDFPEAAAT